ncbi:MAG: hypothetical protein JWP02_1573, partial [Acidimicrobiales bacterium]|nr:hypothetical protein [Acidimicrobiales bacterium]
MDHTVAHEAKQVTDAALAAVAAGRDVIIEAHAGAGKTGGKTSGTVRIVGALARANYRVALLVAQNEQVVDTLDRITSIWPDITTVYAIPSAAPAEYTAWIQQRGGLPNNLLEARRGLPGRARLAAGPGLSVMTIEKFNFLMARDTGQSSARRTEVDRFDVVVVDEAWMASASVWPRLRELSRNVILIGDPGQIMPWMPDSPFYDGMRNSPVEPLPELVRRVRAGAIDELVLAVSRRNPSHTTALTGRLPAYATHPTRPMLDASEVPVTLGATPITAHTLDESLRRLVADGIALHRIPGTGIAPQNDAHVAAACAGAADRLLSLGARLGHPDGERALQPSGVAIIVAHHDQRAAVVQALADVGRTGAAAPWVTTFNAVQGATVDISIVWHPLSGRADVSAFHADAGRLTVGLTRHTHGCIVVSRDGVGERLRNAPTADDLVGDAHDRRYAGV